MLYPTSMFFQIRNQPTMIDLIVIVRNISRLRTIIMFLVAVFGAPALATESAFVRHEEGARSIIVFVHGIGGDGASSWTNNGVYWPNLLTSERILTGSDIYVHTYPTTLFSEGMSIDELADDMRIRLHTAAIERYETIAFIGHSMGGLVVRSYLLKNSAARERTRLLYFLGTPSQGSNLANVAASLGGGPQVQKLKKIKSTEYLADMARQWNLLRGRIETFCAYETRKTNGVMVVEMGSATYLCTKSLDPIDANHELLAKPLNKKAAQYEAFLNAFQQTLIDNSAQGS